MTCDVRGPALPLPAPAVTRVLHRGRRMHEAQAKAAVLIEALPYIQRFRGKPVVIKFGGAAMENDTILRNVLRDVVLMEQVGMRPVLVHGGGPFITAEMARRGKEPTFVEGHRVTDKETLQIAFDVLVSGISSKLVSVIEQHGGRAKCVWDNGSPIKARKHLLEVRDGAGAAEHLVGFAHRCRAVPGVESGCRQSKNTQRGSESEAPAGTLTGTKHASAVFDVRDPPAVNLRPDDADENEQQADDSPQHANASLQLYLVVAFMKLSTLRT